MRRLVRIDNLRSHDPVTLEVVVQDPVRRPLVQIHPVTVLDLVALSEVQGLSTSLSRALTGFSSKVGRELSDLPDEGFSEFLDALEEVPAESIPASFRQMLAAEAEREGRGSVRDRVGALLSRWSETEPAVVTPGQKGARIQRAAAKPPPVDRSHKGIRKADDRPRRRSTGGSGGSTRKAKRLDVSGPDDDRDKWIRQACLERLSMAVDNGLSEQVLVAGLKHRAREDYPDLIGPQITSVLKDLADQGLVRHSAGRWRRVDGRWG